MKPSFYSFIFMMILTLPTMIISSQKVPSYQRPTTSSRQHSKIRPDYKENHSIKHVKNSSKTNIIPQKFINSQSTKTTDTTSDNYSQISDLTDDNEYNISTQESHNKIHTIKQSPQSICAAIDMQMTRRMDERLQKHGNI